MNSLDDEIRICPMCGNKTLWGEMIWLNGKCTCPSCYNKERKRLDSNNDSEGKNGRE